MWTITKAIWIIVGLIIYGIGLALFLTYDFPIANQSKEKESQRIDSLFTIVNTLKASDSCNYVLLTHQDSAGYYSYKWIKVFSREYPWIQQQMDEDDRPAK